MVPAGRALAAARRHPQPLPGRRRADGHPRPADHPPRRRRGPAAGARHARPDPRLLPDTVDLAAAELGGRVVDCSDRFYGSPGNLLLPGLAAVMGDGWETRRRRDAGNDWVEVRLAAPGVLQLAELDTSHFKGNAPGWAALTGSGGEPLLPRTRLQPDTRHRFRLTHEWPVHGARLDIYPDGGMARLRLYGSLTAAARDELAAPWTDQEAGGG
ncbi:hypothetical protein ACFQZ4_11290 [Catellatospora coxensis]